MFNPQYLLNMALCWEIDKVDRAAAFRLFADWWQALEGSSDKAVRYSRMFLQIFGVRCFGLVMYILKKIKRFVHSL